MMVDKTVFVGWDILLIDDDPRSLDVVRRILMHYGATVWMASSGAEALEKLKTLRPKFMISDISMPHMDGWTLMGYIKELPEVGHIPVIALTAHAMAGDRERTLNAGFHNYMSKPLNPSTFVRDIVEMLQNVPELQLKSD